MKRISLFALALSTTATMAVSEDYFEGGILWTTFAPQPKNELAVADNQGIYRSFESTLNDQNNDITGDDRDRVNSIMPLLISEEYYRKSGINITTWTKNDAMDYLVSKPYGALFGGSYKYESKLTYSLSYEQTKKNRADFEEPISVFSHVGKINKLPLPYDEVPNKITAKGVFVSDDNKRVRLEIRSKANTEDLVCELILLINNVVYPLRNGEDETFAMVEMNQGRNTFNITKQCSDTNNMISSAPHTRFTDYDTGFRPYSFRPVTSQVRQRRTAMAGFSFRIIDPETEKQFTQIKNKIKIILFDLVDLHYPKDLQLDPELWSWEGHHYTRFIGADDVHQDGGILPTKQRIDLTNLEMIDKKMQKFELLQEENGLKKMFKGTYYPKTPGVYEILVAKSSNISIDFGYYAPWVYSTSFDARASPSTKSGNAYLYPVYALAMDFARPVAHSIFRDRGVAQKPIEYDWFWFEVDKDDVKYGMDMSIFALGNVGNCYGKDKKSNPAKLRIAGECRWDNRAKRYIYDPGTKEDIERSAAKQIGLLASQKLGFYIKPSNSEKFRAFQQSDFVKLDGSTSKHGHDIDGSSEGRINGVNELDLSDDQPLKGDMELLGGFD